VIEGLFDHAEDDSGKSVADIQLGIRASGVVWVAEAFRDDLWAEYRG